jgi:hypothetical protein
MGILVLKRSFVYVITVFVVLKPSFENVTVTTCFDQ